MKRGVSYVALLRAVNLGGHNKVAMADLRALAADVGLEHPRTLLQSGNLVFHTRPRSPQQLEKLLETEAAKRLGFRTDFLVRTAEEWDDVIARNPFRSEAERDPSHLLVVILREAVTPASIKAVNAANPGRERISAAGRQLYIVFPDGIGRSKLPSVMTRAGVGVSGTARNWNTVVKLAAAMREGQG